MSETTFRESDCEISGPTHSPGGQHVGVVASDVTIRHLPTGLKVTCREHRAQLRNKQQAMQELRELVESLYERHPDDNG